VPESDRYRAPIRSEGKKAKRMVALRNLDENQAHRPRPVGALYNGGQGTWSGVRLVLPCKLLNCRALIKTRASRRGPGTRLAVCHEAPRIPAAAACAIEGCEASHWGLEIERASRKKPTVTAKASGGNQERKKNRFSECSLPQPGLSRLWQVVVGGCGRQRNIFCGGNPGQKIHLPPMWPGFQ
jgi:hypothetical protein